MCYMLEDPAEMTPDQRRCEIAAILARGDPIPWPVALAGDKGYRADWIDEWGL